jgi:hypothetical protein
VSIPRTPDPTTDWLVAIDDTDNEESIGTGRLARMLASHLEDKGVLGEASVTRHQLLVHPDVPYTSHNSSACLRASGAENAGARLLELARDFLTANFHEGANPGLCVARAAEVPAAAVEWARRAQREVLDLEDFDRALADFGRGALWVWSAGETGQGRIGACSGVALRSTGADGRFIGLRGIRDLRGRLRVSEIVSRSGVTGVMTETGERLSDDDAVDTRDWVRPGLANGKPVLVVREEDGRWTPAERRTKDD